MPCGRQGPYYPAYSQWCRYWWYGNGGSHYVNSSHGIGLIVSEYSGFSTKRVNKVMTNLQYARSKLPLLVTRSTLIEYVYGVCHAMSGVTEELLYLGIWEAFKGPQLQKGSHSSHMIIAPNKTYIIQLPPLTETNNVLMLTNFASYLQFP